MPELPVAPWEKEGGDLPKAPWEGGFTKPKGEVSKKAEKHLKDIGNEQKIAGVDLAQHANIQKALEAGAMLPFMVAAPFTEGTSIGFGLSLMGLAGATGGMMREYGRAQGGGEAITPVARPSFEGQTEKTRMASPRIGSDKKTTTDLGVALGIDTLIGAGTQAAAVGVRAGIEKGVGYVGRTVLPKIIERSAAGNAAGLNMLKQAFVNTRAALYDAVDAAPKVDVGDTLREGYKALRELPVGEGVVGEEFSSLGGKARDVAGKLGTATKAESRAASIKKVLPKAKAKLSEAEQGVTSLFESGDSTIEQYRKAAARHEQLQARVAKLEEGLEIANGQISSHQKLAPLVRMQGNLQQLGYEGERLGQLNPEEASVIKKMAEKWDTRIRAAIKGDAHATELYDHSKQLLKTQLEHDEAVFLAEEAIRKVTPTIPERIISHYRDKLGTWALQRAYEADPTLLRKYVGWSMNGQKTGAIKALSQLMAKAGVGKMLQDQ